ncbi:Protein of unknown function [Halopseudomonas salegens]|uniref:DUF3047 domain-containing protein n=2 Tax=Halopseudomonas salegens TaxID=1434072 RepID=A0A1H2HH51_9GAMM|nr:Protein of unknown function [Halopseudomonas salegens]
MMRTSLLGLCLACAANAATANSYQPADILDWEQRDFADPTEYSLVKRDGQTWLQADCVNGASALYLQQDIDLRQSPVLQWQWAVRGVFSDIDEQSKAGDDYPVRLYVVKDGGLLRWRTRAVNYVWSSTEPRMSNWPNAFAGQARMLALQSGSTGGWQVNTEQRNVREDFIALHGEEVDQIDGLAIMTDCDNSGQPIQGWYGPIRWLPATSSSTLR